jgi:calcineurin-like phosphoesterase family protein
MSNTFVCADCHFSHRGIVNFLRPNGEKERPWTDVEEMNEVLISNWNSVVRPKDTVIVLGDFVINRSALPLASRLNGTKELVMGNHDTMRAEEYLVYFKKLHGVKVFDDYIMSHIPLHPASVIPRYQGCVHGHLHSGVVERLAYDGYEDDYYTQKDPRYVCVSMEQINYTPIAWEECKKLFGEYE